MNVHECCKQVHDRASFFAFVRALVADREHAIAQEQRHPSNPFGPDAGGWENTTIEDYLESALSWVEDSDMGTTQGLPEEPTWKAFAMFLYAGKLYE